MEKLTHKRCSGIKSGYWSNAKKQELVDRLAEYEGTNLTPERIREIDKAYQRVCKELHDLKAEQDWIPVEERLPEVDKRVQVSLKHHRWISDYDSDWVPESEKIDHEEYFETCEAFYRGEDIGWEYWDGESTGGISCASVNPEADISVAVVEVMAWRPMPEPYRERRTSAE